MSSAGFTFLLFMIGTLLLKAACFSPNSNSRAVPYHSGRNAFSTCSHFPSENKQRGQARKPTQSWFCASFKDSQFLSRSEGSIGVKNTICPRTTTAPLHIFIVIVRDNKTLLQFGDKCNSLRNLTDLMCRKHGGTQHKKATSNILQF